MVTHGIEQVNGSLTHTNIPLRLRDRERGDMAMYSVFYNCHDSVADAERREKTMKQKTLLQHQQL